MKRISMIASAFALALATPAAAQEQPDNAAESEMAGEMLGAMLGEDEDFQKFVELFQPEPLTPQQEARLPLATQVVGAMIPDGTMADMMSSMFRDIVDPLMALEEDTQVDTASSLLGWYVGDEALDEAAAAEIVAIIDPAREAREAATMDAIEKGIADVMVVIEPAMREAMAKAFAASFSDTELTDIGTFFATPSGAAFASKSYKLASDPTIFVGMLENLPQMLGPIMAAVAEGEQAIAALPEAKTFADLSAAERARLSALSGLTEEELEEAMTVVADEEAVEEAADEWDS
jgi:hypothetical protein